MMRDETLEHPRAAGAAISPAGSQIPRRPVDKTWEYVTRVAVIALAVPIGLVLAVLIGIVMGWIPLC